VFGIIIDTVWFFAWEGMLCICFIVCGTDRGLQYVDDFYLLLM